MSIKRTIRISAKKIIAGVLIAAQLITAVTSTLKAWRNPPSG